MLRAKVIFNAHNSIQRYLVIALFIQTLEFIITGYLSGNGSRNAKSTSLVGALYSSVFLLITFDRQFNHHIKSHNIKTKLFK